MPGGSGFRRAPITKKASCFFGGITTANCDEQFMFGKNDKPLYIQGPSDSPARVGRILRALKTAKAPLPVLSVEQGSSGWRPSSAPVSPA
jgi:hypothetical protein